ncbi:hypothetical protein MHYP_G00185060 [Metynnis hypsauchen]
MKKLRGMKSSHFLKLSDTGHPLLEHKSLHSGVKMNCAVAGQQGTPLRCRRLDDELWPRRGSSNTSGDVLGHRGKTDAPSVLESHFMLIEAEPEEGSRH